MSVQSSSFFLIFWGSLSSWCKFLQIYGFFVMSESKIKLFRSALHADPQITQYPRKHSCITDRHLLCKNLKLKTQSPSQDFTLRSVIPVIGKEREREREREERGIQNIQNCPLRDWDQKCTACSGGKSHREAFCHSGSISVLQSSG